MTSNGKLTEAQKQAAKVMESGTGITDHAATDPRRVVVLSLINRLPLRVVEYIQHLVNRGDQVDLLVSKPEQWLEVAIDPMPRIHTLDRPEEQLFVRRAERLLVFRGPRAVSNVAERVASRRFGQPLRRPAAALVRAQGRVSVAVHKRAFMPVYRTFRPLLLARQFTGPLNAIDFDGVDLVVASDAYTVTLAARLAQLYPAVRVTTGLEL